MSTAVHDLLHRETAAGAVVSHAALLLRLDGVLHQSIPASLGRAVRVANFKAGKIVILAENGAVAVKLRQMTGRLQAIFSAANVECSGVEVKVQPRERLQESKGSVIKPLSGHALGTLHALSVDLPEGPLRAAVQHLIARAESESTPTAPSSSEQT